MAFYLRQEQMLTDAPPAMGGADGGAVGYPAYEMERGSTPPMRAAKGGGTEPATGGAPGGHGGATLPPPAEPQAAPSGGLPIRAETLFSCRRPLRGRRTQRDEDGVGRGGPAHTARGVLQQCPEGVTVPILDNRHIIPSLFFQKSPETRILEPFSEAQVFTNSYVKYHPKTGEIVQACVANRDIFKGRNVEALERIERATSTHDGSGLYRSAQRAKAQLLEYIDCNDEMDTFITLTLAPDKIDRHDYKAAVRAFGRWADNRVRRRGLLYVAVPELHKDGAIHFHGLCNSEACRLVDSHHRDSAGRQIYNVADWDIGYTTAVKLDGSRLAVARYVSKYIVKQWGGLGARPQVGSCGELTYRGTIGGRYYYHGGALRRYRVQHYRVRGYDDIPGQEVVVDGYPGLRLKYLDITQLSNLAQDGRLEAV